MGPSERGLSTESRIAGDNEKDQQQGAERKTLNKIGRKRCHIGIERTREEEMSSEMKC